MVKEYVINSVKYGEVKVLLDDEDYKKIIDNNIKRKRCKTKEDAIKERKLLEERVIKGVINDDSSL